MVVPIKLVVQNSWSKPFSVGQLKNIFNNHFKKTQKTRNMMNTKKAKRLAAALLIFLNMRAKAQDWKMQPVQLQTRWAKEVNPNNALPDYPRPQMTRANWKNLNGLWEYAITKIDADQPQQFDGQILVPYPLESALSGVKKTLQPNQNLWYHRAFDSNGNGRLLLHFGGVDWQTTVYVNGREAGSHTGGYTAFTLDITSYLKKGKNELVVKVYDPTDEGIGPHGKQTSKPSGIFYTSTSGIWQTVWLEKVPMDYIQSLTITPNVDSNFVAVTVHSNQDESVQLIAAGKTVKGTTNTIIKFPVPHARLWSPNDPYLYDLIVKTKADEVKSYFGMRKIEIRKDEKGIDRIFLNNKFTYNLGVLDQGFWPDGIYTAPTDEALAFDIKAVKAMGFNTIRKHIKVEPARWYYWADKLGMLVWQDMVNPDFDLKPGAKEAFENQLKEELEQLHNYPSITTWVLFNEKWGQYDQKRLTDEIRSIDPSRIINGHTGELLYVNEQLRSPSPDAYVDANMTDVHSYPNPMMPIKQENKAQVVGEFGGIGLSVKGHEWNPSTGWGYIQAAASQLPVKYHTMVEDLKILKDQGLSGSIYTQPYDVEGEENGLMTYDREYAKIPIAEIRRINSLLVPTEPNIPQGVTIEDSPYKATSPNYADSLNTYLQGNRDTSFLHQLADDGVKQGDKIGMMAAAAAYIKTLSSPLTPAQITFVLTYTKSTKDVGFQIIQQNKQQFQQQLGDQALRKAEMYMILAGEIAPRLETTENPDWDAIRIATKPYGEAGNEMYLRDRTVTDFNTQNWTDYEITAKAYLDKYSADVKPDQLTMFQNALKEHQNN